MRRRRARRRRPGFQRRREHRVDFVPRPQRLVERVGPAEIPQALPTGDHRGGGDGLAAEAAERGVLLEAGAGRVGVGLGGDAQHAVGRTRELVPRVEHAGQPGAVARAEPRLMHCHAPDGERAHRAERRPDGERLVHLGAVQSSACSPTSPP